MSGLTFSVDTHLFRELGDLLVGRDSTALVELIKNAYDADSTRVVVHGQHVGDSGRGTITVSDNGHGMSRAQFEAGFLRIASRLKETNRKSPGLHRRYTGAKGVGRLAAHKLAWKLELASTPREKSDSPINASIDWRKIERYETLDQIAGSEAVLLEEVENRSRRVPGTVITLRDLKKRWTNAERVRFLAEVQTFSVPPVLLSLPKGTAAADVLLKQIIYRGREKGDPGFTVELLGDFDVGEDYWKTISQAASWIIEVDALSSTKDVRVAVIPTTRTMRDAHPDDKPGRRNFTFPHPCPKDGPFFHSRLLVREGRTASNEEKQWLGRMSGIRVYVEGFRVLPYGEPHNDWLSIDADYSMRDKTLTYLREVPGAGDVVDEREGLQILRNQSYFGAAFLTLDQSSALQMLVNREGFVPGPSFEALTTILRNSVYLSIRVRAAATVNARAAARTERDGIGASSPTHVGRRALRVEVEDAVRNASLLAGEARTLASKGDFDGARARIDAAGREFTAGSAASSRLMTEGAMVRILASVGTQMAAFVHEIHGLLGAAEAIEGAIERLRSGRGIPDATRALLGQLYAAVGDLRRSVERQAMYLTDVTSVDARRRRSRQKVAERFQSATHLIQRAAERRAIAIENKIPDDLKSGPMFPAEMTLVFSNLLSNAVKNAQEKGRIRATGKLAPDGHAVLRIENTGVAVDLGEAERWFRPFESTTEEADPSLGQGMGMGLPITRNLLEEYGATIVFAKPSAGFATAIEIHLPI